MTQPIADLDKKSVLLHVLNHLVHTPELAPFDPTQVEGYDQNRYVSGSAKKLLYTHVAKHRRMGEAEEAKLYIHDKTGKLTTRLEVGLEEIQKIDPHTVINGELLGRAAGGQSRDPEAYQKLKDALEPIHEKLLRHIPEYSLLETLLGKETMQKAKIHYSRPDLQLSGGSSVSTMAIDITLDVDFSDVSIEDMIERGKTLQKALGAGAQNVLRSRIGVTADEVHKHTAGLPDEQLTQFLSALMLGVLTRRNPESAGRQQELAKNISKKMGEMAITIGNDINRLAMVGDWLGFGVTTPEKLAEYIDSDAMRKKQTTMALSGPVGVDVLLQTLGKVGIATLPAALRESAQRRLTNLNTGQHIDRPFGLLELAAGEPAAEAVTDEQPPGAYSASVQKGREPKANGEPKTNEGRF